MNCAEFKESVSALALGALEPEEAAACAAHLETEPFHQGCHEAYARALVTAGKLATSLTPVKPGAQVWAGIEAALDAETRAAAPPRRWVAAAGWAVAAAAAVALVYLWLDRQRIDDHMQLADQRVAEATTMARALGEKIQTCNAEKAGLQSQLDQAKGGDRMAEAVALAAKPDTKKLEMAGKGFHATLLFNPREQKAYVISKDLEGAATASKDFQLWVVRKGVKNPIPAGLMRRTPGRESAGEVDPVVLGGGQVMAIAMSLENRGGSTTGKPGTVLMVGPVSG